MEFHKRNSDDSLYHFRKANISKKYNNQKNLHFVMSDIRLLSKTDRQNMKKKWMAERCAKNPKDQELCKNLVCDLAPRRKRMLMREATCKENPTKKVKVAVHLQLPCSLYAICGHKPYVNPQSLVTHLLTVHPKDYPTREAAETFRRNLKCEAKELHCC
eukprot:Pompholyxophrys_punicea_v1_NODE_140_length_3249_cov_4.736068.p3 type:complete len:159 gc:universal NODE_140_length_3249_cov_4.736068:1298-822(-)